jgi:hypothetical protein
MDPKRGPWRTRAAGVLTRSHMICPTRLVVQLCALMLLLLAGMDSDPARAHGDPRSTNDVTQERRTCQPDQRSACRGEHHCGVATSDSGAQLRVFARRVRCRFARRSARRNVDSGSQPWRWSCHGSGSGGFCSPGGRLGRRYFRFAVLNPTDRVTRPHAARSRYCANPYFASGNLVVRHVSCRNGGAIVKEAASHRACKRWKARPRRGCACMISHADARHSRGCRGRIRIGSWGCHGLFPGEGFEITCRRGKSWARGGAGG